jgi:hypothetical protein
MKLPLIATFLAAWSLFAASQNGPLMSAERIAQERTSIDAIRQKQNAVFAEQEGACDGEFAVTDCLRAVQARRRVVINALKRRETELNAMQRQARNIEQTQRSAERATQATSRRADMAIQTQLSAPTDRQAAQDEKVRNHPQPVAAGDRPAPIKATSVINDNALAQNREAYANKQRAALQKQVERDKRLREGGTAPLGLPNPD